MMPEILVVDDEPDAVELIEFHLRTAGYAVAKAGDGAEAIRQARSRLPSLILLDLMLPVLDGLDVCKLLRRDRATAQIPIIMVTAKAAEIDRVLGLELGADDYVTKPFSPRELVLRIKKRLERSQTAGEEHERYTVGQIVLDVSHHWVTVNGRRIELTATEFKLLALLMQRRGRVQSREQLLTEALGYARAVETRTVDTHLRRLREKLGPAAKHVRTVRNLGYRLVEE